MEERKIENVEAEEADLEQLWFKKAGKAKEYAVTTVTYISWKKDFQD